MEDPVHSGGRALVCGGGGRGGGDGSGSGSAVFGTCAVVCFAVRVGGLVGGVEKVCESGGG